jgi:hypothetical protein
MLDVPTHNLRQTDQDPAGRVTAARDRMERIAQLEKQHLRAITTRSGLSTAALLHISELLSQIADVEISDIRETAVDQYGNGLIGTPQWSAYMQATDLIDEARRMAHQLKLMVL